MPRGPKTKSLEERFWPYVDKQGPLPPTRPDLGNCWRWTGPYAKDLGYGRWKGEDSKMELAHRSAFKIQNGPIPEGHNVFQLCLTRLCVRGDHLTSGPKNSGPRQERPAVPPDKGKYASAKWKDIPGFPGYEASIDGEVRSWWARGHSLYADRPKIRVPTPNVVNGYPQVVLTNEHGKTNKTVHQCVLEAFVGPCPPGMESRHYPDRDPANNKLKNLSYAPHAENMDDKFVHGTVARGAELADAIRRGAKRGDLHYTKVKPELIVRGSKHPNAKLSEDDYDHVLALRAAGWTQKEVAQHVGISQAQVSDIETGKRQR